MNSIAERYEEQYGDGAIKQLVDDLMRDDPTCFKRGYTEDNAVLAAAEVFGILPSDVRPHLEEI